MKPWNLLTACAAAALAAGIAAAPALAQSDQPIYGSQIMTEQERQTFRDRMRSAESASERERIRREHHEQMELRAKERGVTLPDEPPPYGMGRGGDVPGRGVGPPSGMGPGGGMGPGRGMGPGGMGNRGR